MRTKIMQTVIMIVLMIMVVLRIFSLYTQNYPIDAKLIVMMLAYIVILLLETVGLYFVWFSGRGSEKKK